MTAYEIADQGNAIEPGQNRGEFAQLIEILQQRKVKNVMEIGTEGGCTFYAWCKVAAPEGIKISLDWQDSGVGRGRFIDPAARMPRDAFLKSFAPNVVLIEGNSHLPEQLAAVKAALGCELLDFLFIDGDHSLKGVEQDWLDYSPLVRPGGIVAFHDIKTCTYHVRAGCYVHDFWAALRANKTELRSDEHVWGGIGLVYV
jgi:predicted O-methyltransferase YrrM